MTALSPMTTTTDAQLAVALAEAAGDLLLRLREQATAEGWDAARLKSAGDLGSHQLLLGALAEHRPHDVVLSEEGADDPARLAADRVWIVDPLDGTREYAEVPREDWAVHVALWAEGELVAGAVALPARGLTLSSDEPPPLPPRASSGPPVMVVSRTRPPAEAEQVARVLGAGRLEMGSAGAKAMAVLLGDADVYVHAGGQYEWDSAAPVAVARAAGLHCSRVDGSELAYNQPDVRLPDLVICRPEHATAVLAALA